MSHFTLHNQETAPEAAQPLFAKSLNDFGKIPNLHGIMAESPELLAAYQSLHGLFLATSFTAEEKTVVWQAINVEHACLYCVPAHTAIANMMGVDQEISDALRSKKPLPEKLEALRKFTLLMVRKRGEASRADIDAFLAAGYTRRNVLEVILGISQKVMSNYVNHIAETPLDKPFQTFEWSPDDA